MHLRDSWRAGERGEFALCHEPHGDGFFPWSGHRRRVVMWWEGCRILSYASRDNYELGTIVAVQSMSEREG